MSCEFESHLLHENLEIAEVAQLVEHNLAKVRVAGPSPVFRSKRVDVSALFFFVCVCIKQSMMSRAWD